MDPVYLQFWNPSRNQRYWVVQQNGSSSIPLQEMICTVGHQKWAPEIQLFIDLNIALVTRQPINNDVSLYKPDVLAVQCNSRKVDLAINISFPASSPRLRLPRCLLPPALSNVSLLHTRLFGNTGARARRCDCTVADFSKSMIMMLFVSGLNNNLAPCTSLGRRLLGGLSPTAAASRLQSSSALSSVVPSRPVCDQPKI